MVDDDAADDDDVDDNDVDDGDHDDDEDDAYVHFVSSAKATLCILFQAPRRHD